MIDYGKTFSMSRYQFYIASLFYKKSDSNAYTVGSNINSKILNRIYFQRLKSKNNHMIDLPVITSSIKRNVSYKNTD